MNRLPLHLATGNAHKAREMQALADASGLQVSVVAAAAMPAVAEDTGTFAGNARKKAYALLPLLLPDAWVLADDSGLGVDALGGAPGVESAYFAGPAGDGAANLHKLTEAMRNMPPERRGAHFICVLALVTPAHGELLFEGRCDGALAMAPAGGNGFGYDPLFVPTGCTQTYAELGDAEKCQLSHRARAWGRLAEWLRPRLPA